MKKTTLLAGILIVQIALAFVLFFGGSKLESHSGIRKLLEFDRTQIDVIQIMDADGKTVKLRYDGNGWFTEEQFPVDSIRVDRLLNQLSELEHGLAVADSAKAARRFEVDKENFQRRLQLLQDEQTVADFYLGTGAGARRSHIRLAGDKSVFSTTIGSFDLPTEVADWQDKDLLRIETDQIHSIKSKDLTIRKQRSESTENTEKSKTAVLLDEEPEWIADGLAEEETFNTDAFESLLRNLANLRYNRAFKGSADNQNLKAEVTVNYGETSRRYAFYKKAEENEFQLAVSDYEYIFVLPEYTGSRIVENLNREKLIETTEAEVEEATETFEDAIEPAEEPLPENN